MYISNASTSEYIRINDIQDEVIISWADSHDKLELIQVQVIDSTQEAMGCYPDEDSLKDVIKLVKQLSVRGDNLEIKNKLLDLLESTQYDLYQSSEYGKEKLIQLKTEVI